jgi:hypothetical protein
MKYRDEKNIKSKDHIQGSSYTDFWEAATIEHHNWSEASGKLLSYELIDNKIAEKYY